MEYRRAAAHAPLPLALLTWGIDDGEPQLYPAFLDVHALLLDLRSLLQSLCKRRRIKSAREPARYICTTLQKKK